MIKAERLILGDIVYDQVEILPHTDMETYGFRRIFEEYTVMFCYAGRWHCTHEYALSLIHLRRSRKGVHRGEQFETLVIGKDKSYDAGMIILPEDYDDYDIPILWKDGFKTQFVFRYQDGIYITSDFNVQAIRFPAKEPYAKRWGSKMFRGVRAVRSG